MRLYAVVDGDDPGVAVPPDHDIARAPVGFIRPLVDRTGATLLHVLLCSVDETGSAMERTLAKLRRARH